MALAAGEASRAARWWSGPLLHAFALGCAVSMVASGRLGARLIVDGAVSFAFIPVFQALALAVVLRVGRRPPQSWRRALPAFTDGNRPWLLWLVAVMVIAAVIPPRRIGPWIRPALISTSVPIVWSAILDFRFFRGTGLRSTRRAIRDVLAHRAVAWTCGVAYFFGIAIWGELVPRIATRLHP